MYAAMGPAPSTVRTSKDTLFHTVRYEGYKVVQSTTYMVGSANAHRRSARAYSLTADGPSASWSRTRPRKQTYPSPAGYLRSSQPVFRILSNKGRSLRKRNESKRQRPTCSLAEAVAKSTARKTYHPDPGEFVHRGCPLGQKDI